MFSYFDVQISKEKIAINCKQIKLAEENEETEEIGETLVKLSLIDL